MFKKLRGFTLIELLVVISIIALLIGILLPALSAARQTAMQTKDTTRMKGIHSAMVIYAQGTTGSAYPTAANTLAGWDTMVTNYLGTQNPPLVPTEMSNSEFQDLASDKGGVDFTPVNAANASIWKDTAKSTHQVSATMINNYSATMATGNATGKNPLGNGQIGYNDGHVEINRAATITLNN